MVSRSALAARAREASGPILVFGAKLGLTLTREPPFSRLNIRAQLNGNRTGNLTVLEPLQLDTKHR